MVKKLKDINKDKVVCLTVEQMVYIEEKVKEMIKQKTIKSPDFYALEDEERIAVAQEVQNLLGVLDLMLMAMINEGIISENLS